MRDVALPDEGRTWKFLQMSSDVSEYGGAWLEAKQSAGKVTKYLAASSEHSFYHIINIRAIVRD